MYYSKINLCIEDNSSTQSAIKKYTRELEHTIPILLDVTNIDTITSFNNAHFMINSIHYILLSFTRTPSMLSFFDCSYNIDQYSLMWCSKTNKVVCIGLFWYELPLVACGPYLHHGMEFNSYIQNISHREISQWLLLEVASNWASIFKIHYLSMNKMIVKSLQCTILIFIPWLYIDFIIQWHLNIKFYALHLFRISSIFFLPLDNIEPTISILVRDWQECPHCYME